MGACALALVCVLASCGGDPEPEFRWEEEVVYDEPEPATAPRHREEREDEEVDRPPRPGAGGHYGGRAEARERAGAIFSPRRDVFCDEAVRACYTAKGGHVDTTGDAFGEAAARRLERRIDAGDRSAEGIYRASGGGACDRLSGVCYDRSGASLSLTRRELGRGAADQLAARIDRPRRGPGKPGGLIYSPRRGVSCDELVAACYVEDEAHAGYTKREFGSDAARALERRVDAGRKARDGVYRPEGGGVCDGLSEVCYDRQGASARLTRDEFGRQAAARLAERLD